jgi:alginate O-acetyltransferase complex protein AlgI
MLFNSFEFLIFLPIVFLLYWFVFSKNKITQNVFLLIASYVCYSFWDWRFSFLLAFSTILDYSSGIIIDRAETIQKKKLWMRLSIITNIGLLCYFKYLNFFLDSFIKVLNQIGIHADPYTLNIILPIGISFYTFHGVSYVLDIYYGRTRAHKNIIDYSLFVSYFPLLVAGPIERATHLLPQLKEKREFKYLQGVEGCRLILWGMFKKVVIADSLAPIVTDIFANYHIYNSITLILGLVGFAFQVYGDFSGYSDIARGVSKLFGIELIVNFNFPFFSKSIPEFWSRWHISLSLWLNDYVFTPLALNFRHYGKHGLFLAVFITFLLAGLWHGAAWHFVFYGAYFGILYIPSIYGKKGIKSLVKKKSEDIIIKDIPKILLTFTLVCLGFLLFRANGMNHALGYVKCIVLGIIEYPSQFIHPYYYLKYKTILISMLLMVFTDIAFKNWNFNPIIFKSSFVRYSIYGFIVYLVLNFLSQSDISTNFIYFNF